MDQATITPEQWVTIPHAPNYEITRDGRVRNKKTGLLLKQYMNPSNYIVVCLSGSTKGKTFPLHRLLAWCFVEGAADHLEVNHKDGNRLNNAIENLEWVTKRSNTLHRYHVLNSKTSRHKLTEEKVRAMVAYRNENLASTNETAKRFGVVPSMVSVIFRGKAWSHLWPNGKPECLVPRNNRKPFMNGEPAA